MEDQTEPRLLLPYDVRAVQRHLLCAGQHRHPALPPDPNPGLAWGLHVALRCACPESPLPLTVQLEDDIVAKPNYLSTMKNFALQQPSEDWMILEFSQLGFIG